MPRVDSIEDRIYIIEGFRVRIMNNGADVRGDKQIPKRYEAERMSKNNFTVSRWKEKFSRQFPGYDIEVLDSSGHTVRGNVLLSNVRDTYR